MIAQDRPLFGVFRRGPPVPRRRAELRCRVLEVMSASVGRGAPLAPVLAAAVGEERGFSRRALREFHASVDSGACLGDAMESSKLLAFPAHTVAAVRAADGAPGLAAVLASAAKDDAEVENRRATVRTSAFYPLLVLAMAGAVTNTFLGPIRTRLVEASGASDSLTVAAAALSGRVAGWVAVAAGTLLVGGWVARWLPSATRPVGAVVRPMWNSLPIVRGTARLSGGAQLLHALEPCLRAGMPLGQALRRAAPASGCRAVSRSALAAADVAKSGAPVDEVTAALVLPASLRARLALAATRDPATFARITGGLARDCARRYREAIETRVRWAHPLFTAFVGALVFTQLLGIFSMLESVRRQVPTW